MLMGNPAPVDVESPANIPNMVSSPSHASQIKTRGSTDSLLGIVLLFIPVSTRRRNKLEENRPKVRAVGTCEVD